jgi:hypothetical protein
MSAKENKTILRRLFEEVWSSGKVRSSGNGWSRNQSLL